MRTASNSRVLGAVTLLITIFSLSLPAYAKYGDGTGEPNDPYLIYTTEQMNEIGLHEEDWDKHFRLMADIDLGNFTGTDFNIIGYWRGHDRKAFSGVFDGSGHTISNFSYTSTDVNSIALFGYVSGEDSVIKDLGLINPNVDAGTGSGVGALVDYLGGSVTGCYAQGGNVSGNKWVGGLVGYNEGTITNCYSTVAVSGDSEVGGLVGTNRGDIINCYATGTVSGDSEVGGLVGVNNGTITNCYSIVAVSGKEAVGGLVGGNWGSVTNCYSTGVVRGNERVGGLVSVNGDGTVTNSFWDIETSGQTTSAGGMGKSTAAMQMASTFAGWGGDPVWTIDEGRDYPRLWWENMPGEPITTGFYGGGSGTAENPFLIYTAEQMHAIGGNPNDWGKHFKLMADIDLGAFTRTDFNIIGIDGNNSFTGVFDGNGHTILNFSYTSTDRDYIGLFGYVGYDAEIKDLGLIGPNVNAGSGNHVGSLIGQLGEWGSATIINCYVESINVSGNENVGGLVGVVGGRVIVNCHATGKVAGGNSVGGLVGYNRGIWGYGTILSSYASATVTGSDDVGGLVGRNHVDVAGCYSTGAISGNERVGGLVGGNDYGSITTSYSTGAISGNERVGGLVGGNDYGSITSSFWDIQTSGQTTSDGGIGKNTTEMQTSNTYLEAGWDFVGETENGTDDIWKIVEGQTYPLLSWQKYGGGTGESNDPYLIYTAEHLNELGADPNDYDKHFRLMADIDLSEYTYDRAVIAPDVNDTEDGFQGTPFTGFFDGNDHTILNLKIEGESYLGLFGQLGVRANVYNLGLEALDVNGTGEFVGGLVGWNYGDSIMTSYSTGTVNGDRLVGGLVGLNDGDWGQAVISGCYSTAWVTGGRPVGGLVGSNDEGSITMSYSAGAVSGDSTVGGLVGDNSYGGDIISSFWDMHASSRNTSAGGTGLTTAVMQTASPFLDAGWDFINEAANGTEDIWWIDEGKNYPRLWWE